MPASAGPFGKQETMTRPRPGLGLARRSGLLLALPLGTARAAEPRPGAGPTAFADEPRSRPRLPSRHLPPGRSRRPAAASPPRSSPAWAGAPAAATATASSSSGAGRLDVTHSFLHHRHLPGDGAPLGRRLVRGARASKSPLWVVSVPPGDRRPRAPVRPVRGRRLRRLLPPGRRQPEENAGAQGTVVRLGWEANSGTHAWGLSSSSQVPAYKACFRRAAPGAQGGRPRPRSSRRTRRRGQIGAARADWTPCTRATTWSTCGACTTTTPARRRARRRSGTSTSTPPTTATRGASAPGFRAAQAHGKRLGVAEWDVWDQAGEAARRRTTRCTWTTWPGSSGQRGRHRVRDLLQRRPPPQPVPEHALPEGGGALQGRLGRRCAGGAAPRRAGAGGGGERLPTEPDGVQRRPHGRAAGAEHRHLPGPERPAGEDRLGSDSM